MCWHTPQTNGQRGAVDVVHRIGEVALLPPLIAFALQVDWGVAVGVTPEVDPAEREELALSMVDEMERTGRDRAWRTSVI